MYLTITISSFVNILTLKTQLIYSIKYKMIKRGTVTTSVDCGSCYCELNFHIFWLKEKNAIKYCYKIIISVDKQWCKFPGDRNGTKLAVLHNKDKKATSCHFSTSNKRWVDVCLLSYKKKPDGHLLSAHSGSELTSQLTCLLWPTWTLDCFDSWTLGCRTEPVKQCVSLCENLSSAKKQTQTN